MPLVWFLQMILEQKIQNEAMKAVEALSEGEMEV